MIRQRAEAFDQAGQFDPDLHLVFLVLSRLICPSVSPLFQAVAATARLVI
jgi:hypothetical protein